MKCPSCNGNVGLFNPSLRRRRCPHCDANIRQTIRHKGAFLLGLGVAFVPMIMAPAFSDPWTHLLMLAGAVIAVTVGLLAITHFELRAAGS